MINIEICCKGCGRILKSPLPVVSKDVRGELNCEYCDYFLFYVTNDEENEN